MVTRLAQASSKFAGTKEGEPSDHPMPDPAFLQAFDLPAGQTGFEKPTRRSRWEFPSGADSSVTGGSLSASLNAR